jgi:hypothetical protein
MPSFNDVFHLSREVWIAAGVGVVIGMILLALLMRAGRRRHVIVASSPTTELLAFQLSRIADALERVSMDGVSITRETPQPSRDTSPPPSSDQRPTRHVSMSMFGR